MEMRGTIKADRRRITKANFITGGLIESKSLQEEKTAKQAI